MAGPAAVTAAGLAGMGNGDGLVAAALGSDSSVSVRYPKKERKCCRGHSNARGRNGA